MIEICEGEMAWLDMCFNVNKSCLLRCGPRYKKPCVAISPNGNLLREWSTVKNLDVTFESGLKLSLTCSQENKVFRAFNHRLNGSSSLVLTATSLSYEESKNLTPTKSKPLN